MEDLLDTEIGKHDYDWLLTPPGSPHAPALEVVEKAPSPNVPKHTTTRSSSTTRASRLSTSETENGHSIVPIRPARSNSVSRPSIQSTLISSNNRSSVPNASISSVCSRPTTPSKRTSTIPSSKPSILASRQVPTRPSTPTKTRPSTPVKTTRPSTPVKTTRPSTPVKTTRPSTPVKTRPSVPNSTSTLTIAKTTSAQNSRPSTPTSRPRIMSNSSSSTTSAASRPSSSSGRSTVISRTSSSTSTVPSVSRSSSRSSTPTRQPITRPSAPSAGYSPSAGRIFGSNNITSTGRPVTSNGRNSAPSSAPSSRPSSPSRPVRPPVRPLDIPDFPSETPPNLRTKLPQRPLSAGRARPGVGLGPRSTLNVEQVHSAPVKKMAVPAITRSKFSDAPSKVSSLTNEYQSRQSEKSAVEGQPGRPLRSITGADNGFGRTISRKSLDMAIKHMDIRQNLGGIRSASLFPPSIRSAGGKVRPARMSDPAHLSLNGDRHFTDNCSINGHFSGDSHGTLSNNGGSSTGSPDRESIGTKETLSELDLYTAARYEAMLLSEDTINTSWLHNVDDKSDQSPVFDHRFEPLPEPFGPL
uniref:Proline-rich family protein n=1 Tax=Leersia perrieri TaxID=77586 RepID=A0A0D9V761_9ORYZ